MTDWKAFAEHVSLVWTGPTVVLAFAVLFIWAPKTIRALTRGGWTGHDWLIAGVAFGFLGGALDNLYWSIPWTGSLLGSSWTEGWFQHGVYPNILFRQGLGTLAAFCHLKAGSMQLEGGERFLNGALLLAYGSAVAIMVLLALA